jgi:Rieske Fe-S protein
MDPVAAGQAGAGAAQADPKARQEMGRRRFMRLLLGFSLVSTVTMIVTPIIGFLIPKKAEGGSGGGRVLAAKLADLPGGSGKVVAMGSSPVVVVNTEAGVRAFSAVCTHLGCIVEFDSTTRHIVCPCHDGHFSPSSGAVISGPPPQPLKPVTVAVEGDQVFLVAG